MTLCSEYGRNKQGDPDTNRKYSNTTPAKIKLKCLKEACLSLSITIIELKDGKFEEKRCMSRKVYLHHHPSVTWTE